MRWAEPPSIATWLLRHFGSSPNNNDVVIGDLDEQYQRGRSSFWYWRQTAAAIVISFFKEVWSHKLLTIRAVALGWAVDAVSRHSVKLTWRLLFALTTWSRFWLHNWITMAMVMVVPQVFLWKILLGWLVAALHRRHRTAMVLANAVYFACFSATHVRVLYVWLIIHRLNYRMDTLVFEMVSSIVPVAILMGGGIFSIPRDGNSSERASLKA
jgi:hypothetical protein